MIATARLAQQYASHHSTPRTTPCLASKHVSRQAPALASLHTSRRIAAHPKTLASASARFASPSARNHTKPARYSVMSA